jgi:GntR family transcriptional regulator/MocR family aminotransferase
LADFIAAGDFARHLRRARALYGARRAALAAAVARHLPPGCRLGGEAAGLQTPLSLPDWADEGAVVAAAAAADVGVYPLGACYATAPGGDHPAPVAPQAPAGARRPGLLLGFAATDEGAIDEGLRRLGRAIAGAPRFSPRSGAAQPAFSPM